MTDIQSYEPLALRYRPRVLGDVIGQEPAIAIVTGMLRAGRVVRSILLSGPHGTGKTSVARVLAATLNCGQLVRIPDHVIGTPCGTCEACLDIQASRHPDVHEINAADNRGIDEARRLIEAAQYRPRGHYRVFIIDEVHAMTADAFRALLKVLEEPPPATVFLLCTTDPDRVPKEIRSRHMHVKFRRVDTQACARHVWRVAKMEGYALRDKQVAIKIARAVNGHVRDALQVLEAFWNACQGADNRVPADQLIDQAVETIVGEPPDSVAIRYLVACYRGDLAAVLLSSRSVQNPQAFVDAVVRFHGHTLAWWSQDQALRDRYYADLYGRLDRELAGVTLTIAFLADAQSAWVRAATSLRAYQAYDPQAVLMDASLQVLKLAAGLERT